MGKMENLDQKEGKPAGDRGRRKPAPVKRINLTVRGEPALWLEEWIERGLCNSVADAVLFSLQTFHERITNHDTKEEQLKMLRQLRPRNAEVREEG
jgi:Arc/MetJ-type ribon-helix-helix transcriptional regulator